MFYRLLNYLTLLVELFNCFYKSDTKVISSLEWNIIDKPV